MDPVVSVLTHPTRYRASLVQERSRIINRLQKVLEDTNIKLASVASDLMGKSARDIRSRLARLPKSIRLS
jgi:hypothetical protein